MVKDPQFEIVEQYNKDLDLELKKRQDVKRTLLEDKHRYDRLINTIPCALYDYVLWPDGRSEFVYMSSRCKEIFEIDAALIGADATLLWGMVHPEDLGRLQQEDHDANQARILFTTEVRIVTPSGVTKWIQLTSMPSEEMVDSRDIWSGIILDITERKQVEEERDQALLKLQRALAKVKTLSGFLPICCSCKKIRDDKGYWNQIESYIREHSEAEFSHGICPDCVKQLYPEIEIPEKILKLQNSLRE